MCTPKTKIVGLTLIELLMTLTCSLLLIVMLGEIFLAAENNVQQQIALDTIAEHARTAGKIFQAAIHGAGNIGCAKLTADFPLKNLASYHLSAANKITGTAHSLTVRGMGLGADGLTQAMQELNVLQVSNHENYQAADTLLIADCQSAEIFQLQQVSIPKAGLQKLVSLQKLSKRYDRTAQIGFFLSNTFFIKDTNRKDMHGRVIKALYLSNIHNRQTELVEGVNDMNITYDVRLNGQLSTLSYEQIIDWSSVVGLQITLLFSSLNEFELNKSWIVYVAV